MKLRDIILLKEFAPPSDDNGDDGFNEETLKKLAAQWWNGDEDPRVERTLMAAGWEIGQDEGYDNGGVFVVRAGDEHGKSYLSWPAEDLGLDEGVTEGGNVFAPGIENSPAYKAGFATGKLPVPHPEGTQEYAAYYKGVIDRSTPTLNKGVAEEVDTGEYDARKTIPSSKEKNDEVFRKHRERMKALDKDEQGVAEGGDVPHWRVEQSKATGRYYVVSGYSDKSRKVWKSKLGAIDFVKKADAEAKAQELNQGVAEGFLGDREYNRVMPFVKRIAGEVSDYDRDEFGEELWSLLDQKYGSKFAQSVLQDSLDFYWDEYADLTGQGVAEGHETNPVVNAITRRIMVQRPDLLKQYGPVAVGQAIDDVADFVGGVEEIGSSDVSGWVRHVEQMLQDNPPEAFGEADSDKKIAGRHDPDEFDQMVLRLKKLAGAGPLKTVYDPKRRVYKNVPTAEQPKK